MIMIVLMALVIIAALAGAVALIVHEPADAQPVNWGRATFWLLFVVVAVVVVRVTIGA